MGIGSSIFLLALGAILAFAVTDAINGVDLTVVGYILMAAGAIGVALFLTVFNRDRSAVGTRGDVVVEDRVVRERDVY